MTQTARIWSVSAVTLIAAAVFIYTGVHALFYAPEPEAPVTAAVASHAPARTASASGLPARLIIPALNIDAQVDKVGIAASGNMGVPPNFTDVAWYRYGTIPGQTGSAVMDGHVDNGLSLAGVFKHLNTIAAGDDIYVVTGQGTRIHFVVSDVESYPYQSVPTDLIFNQKDQARLNLITCDGGWVGAERTYDHRLVVFATLAS